MNAKMAKDLGFDIISQADGKVEISDTPRSYDPIKSLFSNNDGGGAQAQGFNNPEQSDDMLNTGLPDYGTSKLSRTKDDRGNSFMELTKGYVVVDQNTARRILAQHGVVIE